MSVTNTLLGFQGAGVAATDNRMSVFRKNKPPRLLLVPDGNGVSWNAIVVCGGVSGKGGKKYYLQGGDFFSRLLYPCKYVFPA
jgi:hypothetical protein